MGRLQVSYRLSVLRNSLTSGRERAKWSPPPSAYGAGMVVKHNCAEQDLSGGSRTMIRLSLRQI